jgi:hypothetical protein
MLQLLHFKVHGGQELIDMKFSHKRDSYADD